MSAFDPPRFHIECSRLCAVLLLLPLCSAPAHAQLRGHGGPVRALAISPDGKTAVSGSFDTSAIRWSLQNNAAEQVLRFHDGAVNAVAILPDGRIATAGADARIAIWQPGEQRPRAVLEGHTAPIVSLAVSPGGAVLASASWDRTARLWPLAGGTPRVFEGHEQNVNAVAFMPDGRALVTVGYDATLRIWPLAAAAPPIVTALPAPLNAAVVAGDGEIAAAGANGSVYFLSAAGKLRGDIHAGETPLTALAMSPDGTRLAAGSVGGSVAIIDRGARKVVRTLIGPELPVWSAAFLPDSRTLLTGGSDRMIRRWDAVTGDQIGAATAGGPSDPLAGFAGDPGAEVFRACVACHTLKPDEGERAGPTLAGLMGRRIATLPGYNFSPALKKLDIVWTPETVSKLFELGPAIYTPGTKMPQQTLGSAADRAALVKFLEQATK
ncbi:MAG TPA: c-type cytochrome [Xanthobacteraceae bacterium]|nr:c-type cytochrome [Xanthobacteraceae bacterium]